MDAFIALIAGLSVFMLALWYMRSKAKQDVRLTSLGEQQRIIVEQESPFNQRVAFPIVDALARGLMAILPTSLIGRSKRWLITAGEPLDLSQFFTATLLTCTLLPAAYLGFVWAVTSGSPSFLAVAPTAVLVLFGLVTPLMLLRHAAKRRQRNIWRSLPNALDLMTTCVEAGLSLDFALQRVAERYHGALSDEIHRMLREVALGKPRQEALLAMAERTDLPDVTTFVNSVIQAESMGTSIGRVLRAQGSDLRRRRRQRTEQVARQAPVKMVFPTVFFLMPSLFIITIAPMILNVIKLFNK
jgi:tight adherence protein C